MTRRIEQPSTIVFFEDQAGVGTAKAKGIGHGDVDGGLAGNIGNIIQIAFIAGLIMVDGGRDDIVMHSQRCEYRLDATGPSQQMAGHGFGRADGQ